MPTPEIMDYKEVQAINSVQGLIPKPDREALQTSLAPLVARLGQFGDNQSLRVQSAVRARADALGIASPVEPVETSDPETTPASAIVVKRVRFGTIPLDEIAPDQREDYASNAPTSYGTREPQSHHA